MNAETRIKWHAPSIMATLYLDLEERRDKAFVEMRGSQNATNEQFWRGHGQAYSQALSMLQTASGHFSSEDRGTLETAIADMRKARKAT